MCANKRRWNDGTSLRFDGARFYQLRPGEYSLFTIKITSPARSATCGSKWQQESAKARIRGLTLRAVQGIIRRFPQI
ncbi:DUF2575 domain-containing protein [Erwinia sp. E602]|nr:DUF2575 domain-containing protein [Erwinia sp. E602]